MDRGAWVPRDIDDEVRREKPGYKRQETEDRRV
jgi:hypothetical protein